MLNFTAEIFNIWKILVKTLFHTIKAFDLFRASGVDGGGEEMGDISPPIFDKGASPQYCKKKQYFALSLQIFRQNQQILL